MPAIPTILAQYAEQAAFLWLLRDGAAVSPDYTLAELAALDRRLEAHLDGLRVAGSDGWPFCAEALRSPQGGELFAAAAVALDGDDPGALGAVRAAVEQTPETARELVSALGWLTETRFAERIPGLLAADQALWRRIAVASCAVRRADCGIHLTRALADPDPPLRRRAARAAGELARIDLAPTLAARLADADPDTRFWSAWSLALLGDGQRAMRTLDATARTPGPNRERAATLAARIVAPPDLRRWLDGLPEDTESQRLRIAALGASGDPAAIPWLIARMAGPPALARVAGEAFGTILGIDLAASALARVAPEGYRAGPNDDPADAEVARGADDDLPWPDPERVAAWWQDRQDAFRPGLRYLAGEPVSAEQCRSVLRCARQRERMAAAIELALMEPGAMLWETRAPGFRQQDEVAR